MPKNPIGKAIASQAWVDPVTNTLQDALHKTFQAGGAGGQKVKNALHGTWLRHPLHVVLTDIPIGAWTAAVIFDFMEAINPRKDFARAADSAVSIGLVGAAGAAVTGLTDFQDVDRPASRIGLVHGLLNIAGASLFLASLVKRKQKKRSAGRELAVLGYATALASAYLGGTLVYDEGIGVDRTIGQQFPNDFTPILPEAELQEGELKRVEHNGVRILLTRSGDQILAVAETCTHLGGPLSEGKKVGDTVQCPWHGSRFSLRDGHVVDGPAVHPLPCLEVRVRDGQIEARKRAVGEIASESAPQSGSSEAA